MTPLTPWERRQADVHADCRVYKILTERGANDNQRAEADFFVMDVGDWGVSIALPERETVVTLFCDEGEKYCAEYFRPLPPGGTS